MLLSDEPAAEPPAEEEPEAPPTPSWRPFLVSLATPEEYSLEPLLAKASELDRFEVVEVEAPSGTCTMTFPRPKSWYFVLYACRRRIGTNKFMLRIR